MAHSQFSLAWDAHKNNVCLGLSTLQQNGEFVDMTLAADGHMVKVHQVMLALASPFIKELISSADCAHPVIFLNKISYGTLSSILEYIYTGEVLVSIENLSELVEAGKELHIKGLEDMRLHGGLNSKVCKNESTENLEDEICYFEIPYQNEEDKISEKSMEVIEEESYITNIEESCFEIENEQVTPSKPHKTELKNLVQTSAENTDILSNSSAMQYTVSNQGSLQIILNRYIYYLKHTNKNSMTNWRCVDYLNTAKCPAQVITKDEVVVQRLSAHTHPYHDKKILKKINAGAVFASIHDAELEGNIVREKCFQDKNKISDVKAEDE